MRFDHYQVEGFYDEMFEEMGALRPWYRSLKGCVEKLGPEELTRRQHTAERTLLAMGITFNVYKEEGTEHIFPFDIIPRIIDASEWNQIERGLQQRIYALNLFIDDVYHRQKIVKDGVIPSELIESCKSFLKPFIGFSPPRGIWCHITGTDLIRNKDGRFYVLEDNLRCPSGVAYVLENREIMKRTFPEVFEELGIRPVYDYPIRLLEMLQHVSNVPNPTIALLTPGIYNSAYFEHSFLAQQMGVELVEGTDLVLNDGYVEMRTTKGPRRVDVIYRRLNEEFLDPLLFRSDSLIGVPGIFEAYRKGRVSLVNALGTGVADDKVIYAYVPAIIKYYLNEDIILPNIPTYVCWDKKERQYVLEHIDELVVKEANEAGGYGMLIGPHSTKSEQEEFKKRIEANPRTYIAQPTISFSRVPTIVDGHFEGRHVDLRPFILYGESIYVMPGGLARVALRKGSLVVNSSQGGGSKDTWVLR
ncbi:MAG TPA: circularly permuted type 2 ATP-grasp protein [Thermodesulfobacteriota bacterium]|nr:circularly permuted type 2 ATP-grasp protein [Thermodesulfobacteriota bacterium]